MLLDMEGLITGAAWCSGVYRTDLNASDPNKVKSIIMNLNFSSSQLARISLAEFVSKLIFI